jgi:hypothetical protein
MTYTINIPQVTRPVVHSLAYLMMLSVMGLYSIGDRIINECGTVGGIKIGRQD